MLCSSIITFFFIQFVDYLLSIIVCYNFHFFPLLIAKLLFKYKNSIYCRNFFFHFLFIFFFSFLVCVTVCLFSVFFGGCSGFVSMDFNVSILFHNWLNSHFFFVFVCLLNYNLDMPFLYYYQSYFMKCLRLDFRLFIHTHYARFPLTNYTIRVLLCTLFSPNSNIDTLFYYNPSTFNSNSLIFSVSHIFYNIA